MFYFPSKESLTQRSLLQIADVQVKVQIRSHRRACNPASVFPMIIARDSALNYSSEPELGARYVII